MTLMYCTTRHHSLEKRFYQFTWTPVMKSKESLFFFINFQASAMNFLTKNVSVICFYKSGFQKWKGNLGQILFWNISVFRAGRMAEEIEYLPSKCEALSSTPAPPSIYIHIYVYIYTHTHTYINTYSTYIGIYIYFHMCIHFHVYTFHISVGSNNSLFHKRGESLCKQICCYIIWSHDYIPAMLLPWEY
jgi:hypothetical protein